MLSSHLAIDSLAKYTSNSAITYAKDIVNVLVHSRNCAPNDKASGPQQRSSSMQATKQHAL